MEHNLTICPNVSSTSSFIDVVQTDVQIIKSREILWFEEGRPELIN